MKNVPGIAQIVAKALIPFKDLLFQRPGLGRRIEARLPVSGPAWCKSLVEGLDVEYPSRTTLVQNVSSSGVMLISQQLFENDQKVCLSGGTLFKAPRTATVRWIRPVGDRLYQVGMRFSGLMGQQLVA